MGSGKNMKALKFFMLGAQMALETFGLFRPTLYTVKPLFKSLHNVV